ncbi:MAG: stage 0 sporulation family protein [Firmicutes bacterium]|nr:stage 0 sporulation family protein [Bacillota bacterium]
MVIKMNSYQNRGGRNYRRGGKQRGGAKNIMSEVSAELDEGAASDDSADAPTRRQYSQKNGRRQNQKASGQGGRQGADAAKKEQPIPLYKQIRGSGAKLEEPEEEAIIAAPPENAVEDKNRYRVMSDYWFDDENDAAASASSQEPVERVDIVGVRFKDEDGSKVYYFAPMGYKCPVGTRVIVETARGIEYGYVAIANKSEPKSSLVAPLRPVVRIATEADTERHKSGVSFASEAMVVCAARIAKHGLDMKLIDAEYAFDGSKLTFYFSAEGRVDFRELVKDLASVFHTRIELRQIGIRDEAKMLGGIGICGRPFCCSTFLYDFNKVSIEMAKEQGLSLNTAKISGACGRLMCCLRYEADSYAEEIKRTPRVGNVVKTPDGVGTVTESQPLTGKIKVKVGANDDAPIREFVRDDVTVLAAKGKNADKKAKEQPKAADGDENVELPPED